MPHRSWYTGRCYIWYSEEGTGRGHSLPRPLLAVPNVTAHPIVVKNIDVRIKKHVLYPIIKKHEENILKTFPLLDIVKKSTTGYIT